MSQRYTRREWLVRTACAALAAGGCGPQGASPTGGEKQGSGAAEGRLEQDTFDFIERCRREDGGYAPFPDPEYEGESDTKLSDLAAVTYAAVLAKTVGRELPHADRSADFIHRCQQPDGSFLHVAGAHDPKSDLAVLYDTTQAVVGLRALGQKPRLAPAAVPERFFVNGAYKQLPLYTTSFFPLFYAALGKPFPPEQRAALAEYLESSQKEDGYLGDHVAATFHMAHFFRLIGQPTPRADRMVERVLRDQKPDGGWNIKAPDWDVHACFDAVFILRQLGGGTEPVRAAIDKGADWALSCRNADGGFGHFPGRHSDMDAVYFQFGTLIQAGRVPGAPRDLPDAHTLGWGHAMQPDRVYA
jgi:prenyltransferase/squalene oxidase-like repeat protein